MKDSPPWGSLSTLLAALDLDTKPRRVLVVEDDTAVRTGLSGVLEACGHQVDAREGVELEELPLAPYGAAFLDHYFLSRSMNGVSLAPELIRGNPQIRIAAMSSDAGKNAEIVRMGASLAIAKSALRRLLSEAGGIY